MSAVVFLMELLNPRSDTKLWWLLEMSRFSDKSHAIEPIFMFGSENIKAAIALMRSKFASVK